MKHGWRFPAADKGGLCTPGLSPFPGCHNDHLAYLFTLSAFYLLEQSENNALGMQADFSPLETKDM